MSEGISDAAIARLRGQKRKLRAASEAKRLAVQRDEQPGKTHYEHCWRDSGHHECALSRIEELERALTRQIEQRQKWHSKEAE